VSVGTGVDRALLLGWCSSVDFRRTIPLEVPVQLSRLSSSCGRGAISPSSQGWPLYTSQEVFEKLTVSPIKGKPHKFSDGKKTRPPQVDEESILSRLGHPERNGRKMIAWSKKEFRRRRARLGSFGGNESLRLDY
jgi:hypothetical protein